MPPLPTHLDKNENIFADKLETITLTGVKWALSALSVVLTVSLVVTLNE